MNKIKTILGAVILTAFCASAAQAAYVPMITTTGNNFTMLDSANNLVGGTNDVTFTWDGTYRTGVVTDGSYNATISSPTPFFGVKWFAHDVNIYAPGNYTLFSGCAAGNASCGIGSTYNLSVGNGQLGTHMLFNWGPNTDIDVVVLWDLNKSWADTGTASPLQSNALNTINTVWSGVSLDTANDTDNYSGSKMIDGPFVGFSANFNVNGISAVPLPATVWLLGSGLLGMIGVARRKTV